jgi:hypothetical protein
MGLITPHRKKNKLVTQCHERPRTWIHSLDKRFKRKKIGMRFGTWNLRSIMYKAGLLRGEQEKHRINVHIHPCLECDSNPRSKCSSERRQFMP